MSIINLSESQQSLIVCRLDTTSERRRRCCRAHSAAPVAQQRGDGCDGGDGGEVHRIIAAASASVQLHRTPRDGVTCDLVRPHPGQSAGAAGYQRDECVHFGTSAVYLDVEIEAELCTRHISLRRAVTAVGISRHVKMKVIFLNSWNYVYE